MKILGKVIALFSAKFFSRDWISLRERLIDTYREHSSDESCRPSYVLQALLISGEDHRFFAHNGFDPIAALRAVWRGAFLGKKEGASTIEMQIVRVLTGRFERTVRRKIKEIALATLITKVVPKKELPGLYLRVGYYGWKMNSLAAACKRLKLKPGSIALSEAGELIARLKYPEPRMLNPRRLAQIRNRSHYLLALHETHSATGVYSGLVTEARYAAI